MESTTETTTENNTNETNGNHTVWNEENEEDPVLRAFIELYTLICILCVAANVLITFVILKYKRLRQEKSNVIILNWTIINFFFVVLSPITFRLAVDAIELTDNNVYCVVEQLQYNLMLVNILLIVLLTMFWYMKLYCSNNFVRLVQHLKFFLASIYVFALCCAALHVDACYNSRFYKLSEIFLLLSYLAFILFMIIINIVHAIKKRSLDDYSNLKNLPFILTNSFFFCCLPILLATFRMGQPNPLAAQIVISLAILISVMSPIFFIVILYKCDKDYNTFFRHVLSYRCSRYKEELVEQSVVYNNDVENRCR